MQVTVLLLLEYNAEIDEVVIEGRPSNLVAGFKKHIVRKTVTSSAHSMKKVLKNPCNVYSLYGEKVFSSVLIPSIG